jgi:hypothetical protein
MAGRLGATASYLDDVAAWLVRGRRALAGALAECLGSAEAVALRGAPGFGVAHPAGAGSGTGGVAPGPLGSTFGGPATTPREVIRAAADLGAHVLAGAAEILDDGQHVLDVWAGRLDDLPYPISAPVVVNAGGQLEIG